MHDERVVYLLGAGFSAPLGLPVMSNFLHRAKDLFATDPESYEHFQVVFNEIKDLHVAKTYYDSDLLNIEEILSIMHMGQLLKRDSVAQEFVTFLSDVIKAYTPEFKTKHTRWPGNVIDYPFFSETWSYYSNFVSTLLNLKVSAVGTQDGPRPAFAISERAKMAYSVITLNYDLILELAEQSIHRISNLECGFCPDSQRELGRVPLAKLHGSVDKENIVPPTWNKGAVSGDIQAAWSLAAHELTHATHIRILGYSLPVTDSYIKYLLKHAVVSSPHLKSIDVVCLDPTEAVEKNYRSFITYRDFRFQRFDVRRYLELAAEKDIKPSGERHFVGLERAHAEIMVGSAK